MPTKKQIKPKTAEIKKEHVPSSKLGRYFEAVGRRKTAIARVRLFAGAGKITANDKEFASYFPSQKLQSTVTSPLERLSEKDWTVNLKLGGGGVKAQAEAARLGIARALVKVNPEHKKQLRALGFLTRDPRMVERKKYGLKKARRAPQWAKR
jgi:small subunit ribosomal protein S9